MTTDEMLLYGGLAAAAVSAAALVVHLLLCRIQSVKLENQLEKEYGPKNS